MDKKELKLYETPAQEIIDLGLEAQLLAGSGTTPHVEDEDDDDELPH